MNERLSQSVLIILKQTLDIGGLGMGAGCTLNMIYLCRHGVLFQRMVGCLFARC